jgi:glycine betaine catabolism A
MNQPTAFHPASPILDFCPPSLPARWYHDAAHFNREIASIHARQWNYVGRVNDLPTHTLRRVRIAGHDLFLVKDDTGTIRCFHNSCRHRGSALCTQHETKLTSGLITCPYHAWSYDLTGALRRIPHVPETPGFDRSEHGLLTAQVTIWNGFIFICLKDEPPAFESTPDVGVHALDNWPMDSLVTGHRMVRTVACNWKVFWENYNECLHCPGVHPSLCDMVPVYGKGVMSANELPEWTPNDQPISALKSGARSWTRSGRPCGLEFPNLTDAQRQVGHVFVTLIPSMYIVAHVDYVRAVSVKPVGPEETELTAEWLFPAETLSATGFDLADVTTFAETVMQEDGKVCEINQLGLRNAKFVNGTLMPQEFDVYRFQQWVRHQLGEPLHDPQGAP